MYSEEWKQNGNNVPTRNIVKNDHYFLVVNYALHSSTKKSIVSHQKVVKGARERPEVRHNRNGAALLLKNTFVLYQSNSPQWGKKKLKSYYNFLIVSVLKA